MGSKLSKTNEEEVKIEPKYFGRNAKKNKNIKNDSDAFSTSQQTENIDSTIISQNSEKDKNNEEEKTFPFKFEWKGLGSIVVLAGSFLENWTKFVPMVKNPETEIFEKIIKLPKKKHYFKFIVDNKWICSNQYPTTIDNSYNLNNFIDLTNYIPPKDSIKKEENKKEDFKPHKSKVIVSDKKDKSGFNNKYPLIHDLNTNAPYTFTHYIPCFDLDYQSRQNKIKKITNKNYLNYYEKNTLTENNTYKKILSFPHEKLLHFCQNINNVDININTRYIKNCTTIRNRNKYLTVVYFRPK